jgi:type IV secretion system protein VirD4
MILFFKLAHFFITILRWLRGLFRSTSRGQARWMNKVEMRLYLRKKNKGLIFSPHHRLSLDQSFKNLGLIAPTGSGKTTRFVIPNILNCAGSVVVTDPSGEIFKLTSGHMQKRGYKIQILNPANPSQSLRFNPLKRFNTQQKLKQIATTLGMNNAGKEPYWNISAVNIIYICLLALNSYPDKKYVHIGNIRKLLNNYGVNGEGIKDFMTQFLDDSNFDEFKSFFSKDSKLIGSILSTAEAALDIWSDPEIVRLTSSDNISIESLRNEKTIIYIMIPEHKIKYFSLLVNLFYSACFEYCLEKSDGLPVFFFLDEFGNLGKINNFASIATTLRKKKCSINIILQELSQLEAIYGKSEAKAIFSGGMANKLFLSGLDLESCTYLEKILGTITQYDTVFGGFSEKVQTIARPLLTLDKIRMLDESKGILISGRQLPIKIKMPAFFQCKAWHKLTQEKPADLNFNYSDEKVNFIDLAC